MSHELSVLQRATRADVHSDPFPHIVLHDALPVALYNKLASTFPSPEQLGRDSSQNNTRWNYSCHKVKRDTSLPRIWRDFIVYHSSKAFFDEIAALFYDDIYTLYPDHFPTLESLKSMRAGVRKARHLTRKNVLMDAQISGNTPVAQASSVRTTHVDNGDKLYSGLFYMRPDDYDATGGNLTISRFKADYPTLDEKLKLYEGPYVDDRHVDHVRTVEYDKNTLVLFINSLESLHGVTIRQPSNKSRLFVNLVGEIDSPLYRVQNDTEPAKYLPANSPP